MLSGQWKSATLRSLPASKTEIPHKKNTCQRRSKQRCKTTFQLRARSLPVCILPALCRESACGCCPRTPPHCPDPGSAHPPVPAVIQPVTSAQRAAHMKATLKVPTRTAFVFDAWSQVPLRKWKEREITSKSLGRFSY